MTSVRPRLPNDKANCNELLDAMITSRAAGISIIPIDHRTKRPAMRLLPTGDDGKPTWAPFQEAITDEASIRRWANSCKAFAVVCGKVSGGLLVLDFDVPRFYDAWRETVGSLAVGLPVQQTGGGGFQVYVRTGNPGKTIIIESEQF